MIDDARVFQLVRGIVTPEDFTEEFYKKCAELLFEQLDREEAANPAQLINLFETEEEQNEIAGLFNARIREVHTQEEKEKALKETILRVKENSMNYRSAHLAPSDMAGLMRLVQDKKDLEELENLHISID